MRPVRRTSILILLLICGPAAAAWAQTTTVVGVRAAGMGGAFTAVADDASAVVWNPAGLASGAFVSAVVDRNAFNRGASTLFVGLAGPPVGLAYYRIATGALQNGRRALVADHAGVSLVQSIGNWGLAAGATLEIVHGVAAGGQSADKFDVDIGVMKAGALGKIGLTIRDLLAPEFGAVRLERAIRAGGSLSITTAVRLAADVDFTTANTPRGRSRVAAVGVEDEVSTRAWVRAGLHWNTAGRGRVTPAGPADAIGAAPTASVGGSYAIRGSLIADAQVSVGSASSDRGWGVGGRFVF
jgi:hypothetical protein